MWTTIREVCIQIIRLVTRFRDYLVHETLPRILSDFSMLVTYSFLFLLVYCLFIGSLALMILSPKKQMFYTFVTAYQYDYLSLFLDLPVIVQRVFWFLSLFVIVHFVELWIYPATYRKRLVNFFKKKWTGR